MSIVTARNLSNLINTIGYWEPQYSTDSVNYAAYHQQSNENEHRIEVPLVGMTRENLTVDIQDGVLTVSATTDAKSRFVRNFKQSWTLSKDSDVDNVAATLENGLLTVVVPRVKPAKKTVNINVV